MLNQLVEAQRDRVLKHLQTNGSATTIELRHDLDVLAPAPRVFELRHIYGHNIVTLWEWDYNPKGGRHLVARYELLKGDNTKNKQRKGRVTSSANSKQLCISL